MNRTVLNSLLLVAGFVGATAIILYTMGQPLICKCGYVKLWHGVVISSENSQHLSDWYTPSHIIHGILFFGLFTFLLKKASLKLRLALSLVLECAWEILENTDMIINRYREATISLDYFGDSVINSSADILAMVVGFFLAARLPVWASVAIIVVFEATTTWLIRDGLALNILMLVWPLEAVKAWQGG
ncbi:MULTISPECIES: DUF2585 domain-containing protein [unclassified Shinella]|uniref:DUF2585 domain-containing protein n=1 Tax=unclassified Shinella TaxID=2643062 RepID=UPI0003C56D57|nr:MULTISPECIES: DUF2585 domain-containing protein [unclassified Shinella]EYR79337.1 hypothetical protein UPF0314 [Shinella sp. DD12]MCA0342843.1 DUF2585 domain-containing protein [Pseudomonadota bacterium]MCO5151186.1 DUF2585 domain-containing protein [Shinella sp.]MDG4672464.1 DUF2585 domain-containing protein [Shinella sp. 838]